MASQVAVIPGEDAAPEAVRESLRVIDALRLGIEWQFPEVGVEAERKFGTAFPEAAKAAIDACDATLFGATSGPSARALFYLRWGKQTFANVRPTRWSPGVQSPLAQPEGVDFAIVRENLEDLYLFLEGPLADLAPLGLTSPTTGRAPEDLGDGRYALKAVTEAGAERVIRFAFQLARKRRDAGSPGHVTLGAKWNMLPRTDGLFRKVGDRIAQDFPDVGYDRYLIDDLAHRLVSHPHDLDVVVLPNLYGDILSDAAAGLCGGLGLAASGCFGEDYAYFESAHGTAPDLAGKGIINPTATLLSAGMMLEYLGHPDAARQLARAVDAVYASGKDRTPDQGGSATTGEFCDAVIRRLAG
ncbi:MAG: isocitrate/isopropylmalate family dehydrogenase [Proteobacteria bacterium]|nr:isocitrate/isopropylmalate family dehydrogenase [Pseudomonadota bacterium]